MQTNPRSGLTSIGLVALLVASGLLAMPFATHEARAAACTAAVSGAPTITSETFKDNDANGHLDQVDIQFSECVHSDTGAFPASDWIIGTSPNDAPATGSSWDPTNAILTLYFREKLDLDSGPATGSTFAGLQVQRSSTPLSSILDSDSP